MFGGCEREGLYTRHIWKRLTEIKEPFADTGKKHIFEKEEKVIYDAINIENPKILPSLRCKIIKELFQYQTETILHGISL